MTKTKMIDLILDEGNPTQKYIVQRDILGVDIKTPDMLTLQEQILNLKEVKKWLLLQNNDGWFGIELHGGPGGGFDGTMSRLKELGVEAYHPFMQRAKQALLLNKDPKPRDWSPVIEEYNWCRACILAHLYNDDEQDKLLLQFQDEVISKYGAVTQIESLDEVSRELTSKRFTETRAWKWHPDTEARGYLKNMNDTFLCASNMFMLGACLNWKNSRTERIVTEAYEHIASFAPIPIIFYRVKTHWVGPFASYEMLDHEFDNPHMQAQSAWWLRDYYHLSKICDVEQVPHYYNHIEQLAERVADDSLIDNISDTALTSISKTYGYSCEWDRHYGYSAKWKREIKKQTDIYFPVLLVLHYAKIDF